MKKTLAELIDELCITNIKIALLIENKGDYEKVQKLNSYRSQLKNAISEELGQRKEIKT